MAEQKKFQYNTAEWKRTSKAIIARDKQCVYCGHGGSTDNPLTADHIVPRSRGGDDSPGNLVAACRQCNSTKNNKVSWRTDWINPRWL